MGIEGFEAESESLNAKSKKKSKSADSGRKEELKTYREQHLWHVSKLELVLRSLDNHRIDLAELAVTKESIDYYMEDCQTPDFYFDDSCYDALNLDEFAPL